ncbi:MAG: NYN domain-containing protein [Azovibrio sp.]|uniref:NYN domain-containing protein n=1 Tax=Azovibrio sp. TaxID=1872673 RepID=UPI003C72116C
MFALFRDHVLDPEADLVEVRYYTAPVLGRMCDDQETPQRQRRYLQALRKMYPTQITIIEGKIIATTPFQRLVKPIAEAPDLQMVQVYDFNEKKTDVNLAADLIAGAWTGACDQAVVCSNDTDLEAALATVRRHHPEIRLGLVAPIPGDDHRRISTDLSRHAHWSKPLSPVYLRNAQLPEHIPHSALRKPESW